MIPDSDVNFEERNTNRIDIAQIKAEEYLKNRGVYYKNIGFDSKNSPVPSKYWFQVPEFLKKMPDMFVIAKGLFYFLEVKGCRDSLKIKLDDWNEYALWNNISTLMFFIYSVTYNQKYLMSFKILQDKFINGTFYRYSDNNKLYIDIPVNEFQNLKE